MEEAQVVAEVSNPSQKVLAQTVEVVVELKGTPSW